MQELYYIVYQQALKRYRTVVKVVLKKYKKVSFIKVIRRVDSRVRTECCLQKIDSQSGIYVEFISALLMNKIDLIESIKNVFYWQRFCSH